METLLGSIMGFEGFRAPYPTSNQDGAVGSNQIYVDHFQFLSED